MNYLRTSSGKEIDFVLTDAAGDATHFIEVKWSDDKPSFALRQMARTHPKASAIQLLHTARHAFDIAGGEGRVEVRPAVPWLGELAV